MSTGNPLTQVLGEIAGGRVVDMATSAGGFAGVLAERLKSYTSIAGIDVSASALGEAHSRYGGREFQFAQMDAGRLGFACESADTVALSATLHHLPEPSQALAEAVRILRPHGRLVLAEMHNDGETKAQRTMVQAHHWVADADTALGGLHHHTMARQEIVDLVEALGLDEMCLYDHVDSGACPMDTRRRETLGHTLARCLERVRLVEDHEELAQRGEALRRRLHRAGAQPEPVLIVVGTKE